MSPWATADTTDEITPTMMKSLMQGANFTATVDNANTQQQKVLNTGSKSGAHRMAETVESPGRRRLSPPAVGARPQQRDRPGLPARAGPRWATPNRRAWP